MSEISEQKSSGWGTALRVGGSLSGACALVGAVVLGVLAFTGQTHVGAYLHSHVVDFAAKYPLRLGVGAAIVTVIGMGALGMHLVCRWKTAKKVNEDGKWVARRNNLLKVTYFAVGILLIAGGIYLKVAWMQKMHYPIAWQAAFYSGDVLVGGGVLYMLYKAMVGHESDRVSPVIFPTERKKVDPSREAECPELLRG